MTLRLHLIFEARRPAISRAERPYRTAIEVVPRAGAWLDILCLSLLGYALFGKGWASIGFPPAYVGEGVLFLGLLAIMLSGEWVGMLRLPPAKLLALMGVWGLARTWSGCREYGIDALRDAVIWGYGLLALVVSAYICGRPSRLVYLLSRYRRFMPLFLLGIPVVWIVCRFVPDRVPNWPWADIPIMDARGGDVLVHLSGILGFCVAGLAGRVKLHWLVLLAFSVGLVGAYERGGLLSFVLAAGVCFLLKPRDRSLRFLTLLAICGLAALAITSLRIEVPVSSTGKEREVSFRQFADNMLSIAAESDTGELDDNRRWRLDWWREIVRYTLHGPYFWTGKGFGINLADDDGFQVMADHSLRNPHNAHLAMLARAGAPGLLLWTMVQLSWAWEIVTSLIRSQRARDTRWSGLFLFLLAYWVAFMTNATFDVFIEGPMGGIWFWAVYGTGLAAVWLYRHHPELLHQHASPARP